MIDISLHGYQAPIGTPTESTKGGVLNYIKKGLNFKPRDDLNMYKKSQLESCFVEIINNNDSNDIVGVIYRHPLMNPTEFMEDHLSIFTDKIPNSNKKVGDFTFNLLNSSSHCATFDFLTPSCPIFFFLLLLFQPKSIVTKILL